jgi:Putative prokaryotic signal transducing protein
MDVLSQIGMTTLKSFSNLAEAGFASSLLEAAGIPTLLADEQSSLWSFGLAIPIRLQVEEADVGVAREILEKGLQAADGIVAGPPVEELAETASGEGNMPVGLFVAAAVVFVVLSVIAHKSVH